MRTMFRTICLVLFAMALTAGVSEGACGVSPATLSFGSYSIFSLTPLDSTVTLNVTCTPNTKVTVSIGPSATSGGIAQRQMSSPATPTLLNYNVYTNKKRSIIWGDGADSVTQQSNKKFVLYGRIPAGQSVQAGSYSDTLIITVTP